MVAIRLNAIERNGELIVRALKTEKKIHRRCHGCHSRIQLGPFKFYFQINANRETIPSMIGFERYNVYLRTRWITSRFLLDRSGTTGLAAGVRDATSRKEVSSVRGRGPVAGDNLLPFNRPSLRPVPITRHGNYVEHCIRGQKFNDDQRRWHFLLSHDSQT